MALRLDDYQLIDADCTQWIETSHSNAARALMSYVCSIHMNLHTRHRKINSLIRFTALTIQKARLHMIHDRDNSAYDDYYNVQGN